MIEFLTPRKAEQTRRLNDRPESSATDTKRDVAAAAQDWRTPGEQDRDRILYSAAFQRLAYVTQITAPESGYDPPWSRPIIRGN